MSRNNVNYELHQLRKDELSALSRNSSISP
jgi:hypothetical protein